MKKRCFNGERWKAEGNSGRKSVPATRYLAKSWLCQMPLSDRREFIIVSVLRFSEELMIHLYFTNINMTYFGFMKENGYTGITMNELKHLAEENMNQVVMTNYFELFRKENFGKVLRDGGM